MRRWTSGLAVAFLLFALSGCAISRLYDRVTGGTIDADHDDAEFDQIITEINTHTAAVAPHSGHVLDTGDTMTGNLVMDGADVRIWDGNDLKLYSDGGSTQKLAVDGATGNIDAEGTLDVLGASTFGATVSVTGASTFTGTATVTDGAVYGLPLTISKTLILPEYVQDQTDAVPILAVEASWAPNGITVTDCGIKTNESSSYSVGFEEWTSPSDGSPSTIETVATSSSLEAEDDATIDDGDIAAGSIIMIDLPTTTGLEWLQVWITYEVDAS